MNQTLEALADQTLQELMEVSPQVEHALVITLDGAVIGSAPATSTADVRRVAGAVSRMLDAADRARQELGREAVTQCEVGTGDASVFVVRDAHHAIAATTGLDPTVGLVFYDLKSALRTLRDHVGHVTTSGNGSPADTTTEGAGA